MAGDRWRLRAERIDRLLIERRSPLANLGLFFVAFGQLYGFDGRLTVAIAGAETTFGTDLGSALDVRRHNAWGYAHPPGQQAGMEFPSWRRGIKHVSWALGSNYVLARLDTIDLIGPRWVGSPYPADWLATVKGVYAQLGGDPDATVAEPRL